MADQTSHTDEIVHRPSESFIESSNVRQFMRRFDIDSEEEFLRRTTTDIEWFWDVLVSYLDIEFDRSYDTVRDNKRGPQFSSWYPGGQLNIAHNTLDRYGKPGGASPDAVAVITEDEHGNCNHTTFSELYHESNRVANFLQSVGVGQGDTVGVYMPKGARAVATLYGCFKLGAVAVPLFTGYGTSAVKTRLNSAGCSILVTADGYYRRGTVRPLVSTIVNVIDDVTALRSVVVSQRVGECIPEDDKFCSWENTVSKADPEFETKSLKSEAKSMILFTSGTTGEPKGTIQTHAGQLLQCAKEVHFGFDHQPDDRFFWVTDMGWVMGAWTLIGNHTFGGTVFLYEGSPDYPSINRYWELIEKHSISVFGTSPSAVRTLRENRADPRSSYDLSSLRILGSTGEPWDEDSWLWFYKVVGGEDCPIINISGGTEICGCFLLPLPTLPLKACTLGGPSPGMSVDIVDEAGNSVVDSNERGYLVARDSCPSMTKSLLQGDNRYLEEYWSRWDDLWDHGDWAECDSDGYWFLHGRADDVVNIAGRRVGPSEVESIISEVKGVREVAVVGQKDKMTNQSIKAYVRPSNCVGMIDEVSKRIQDAVESKFGKPFIPDDVVFLDRIPKTESGKTNRNKLIEEN